MKRIYFSYKKEIIVISIFSFVVAAYYALTFSYGTKGFVVISGSMEPALSTGSIIYTTQKNHYDASDVITFNQDGRLITHRIVGVENVGNERFYRTKGDANSVEDSSLVHAQDIVGATAVTLPQIGKIVMIYKTPIGFAAGIVLPTLLFFVVQYYSARKNIVLSS